MEIVLQPSLCTLADKSPPYWFPDTAGTPVVLGHPPSCTNYHQVLGNENGWVTPLESCGKKSRLALFPGLPRRQLQPPVFNHLQL